MRSAALFLVAIVASGGIGAAFAEWRAPQSADVAKAPESPRLCGGRAGEAARQVVDDVRREVRVDSATIGRTLAVQDSLAEGVGVRDVSNSRETRLEACVVVENGTRRLVAVRTTIDRGIALDPKTAYAAIALDEPGASSILDDVADLDRRVTREVLYDGPAPDTDPKAASLARRVARESS